ncbi:hypothetical protein QWU01_12570 [Kluyvera cryocrescens]|uniref:Uncharacterized protein n=1 Tax=Kluyvera cryocrescens TaxID=580 RepID=A0AAW9C626_KLUCR|nr:hypothetical protein [Kluyvera cryocrescens]MDW3777641.1 hypothetical protein [Kluyvera cryocrescens]
MEMKKKHITNRHKALDQAYVQLNFTAEHSNRPASVYPILQKYRITAE